jgi:hypothetical protein
MGVKGVHFPGKEFRAVLPVAAGALVHADIEDLVHAGMERIGMESVTDFVNHIEDHSVDFGMQRTVAFAIEAVLIGPFGIMLFRPDGRGLVKLRVFSQEGISFFCPGLVSQEVYLRDQADAMLLAGRHQLIDIGLGERVLVTQLRMLLVVIVPVHAEDEEIHLGGGQVFLDKLDEKVHPAGIRGLYGKTTDGKLFVDITGMQGHTQGQQKQKGGEYFFHGYQL